jgi:hypothetical protein
MRKTDFYARNCHSIIMLYPETKRAAQWVEENITIEEWQSRGNIAIEPRYFEDIHSGILSAGMSIKPC